MLRSRARRLRICLASNLRAASVTVRANYVGLPSMAGRGTDDAAKAAWLKEPVQSPEVRLRGRNRRKWSAERRGIP